MTGTRRETSAGIKASAGLICVCDKAFLRLGRGYGECLRFSATDYGLRQCPT